MICTTVVAGLSVAYGANCLCPNGTPKTDCKEATEHSCESCTVGFFQVGNFCEACGHSDPLVAEALVGPFFENEQETAEYTRVVAAFKGCNKCDKNGCTEVTSDQHYLDADTKMAEACTTGCLKCTEAGKCSANEFAHGYYSNSGKPEKCAEGCNKCTEGKKCSPNEFAVGWSATSATDNTPRECPAGCRSCPAGTTGTCDANSNLPGYMLDANNKPIKCADKCSTCTAADKCTAAEAGHSVKDHKVIECSEGCTECSEAKKCDGSASTEAGYYFDTEDKVTKKCATGCAECTGATTCTTADTYYYLDDGAAKKCKDGCAVCTTSADCTVAKPGWFVENNEVDDCGKDQCFKCRDAKACEIPKADHKRNENGKLGTCGHGCQLCIGEKCVMNKSGSISRGLSQLIGAAMLVLAATLL